MGGPAEKARSTRLAIVEKSLTDTLERLREMPPGPRVREIRTKAEGFLRVARAWSVTPPSEGQRVARLKLALDLNVEAMALGREGGGGTLS
jgi:hypothetical protein